MDDETKRMFDKLFNKLDNIEEIVNRNHVDVIKKLEILEKNQDAIKNYIFNSDETFKKVEDDHRFIQNLKKVASE